MKIAGGVPTERDPVVAGVIHKCANNLWLVGLIDPETGRTWKRSLVAIMVLGSEGSDMSSAPERETQQGWNEQMKSNIHQLQLKSLKCGLFGVFCWIYFGATK